MAAKAVQQIMLGSVTKTEAQAMETLRAIKKAGYDGIELNGFMIRPTSWMVRMMTKAAGMPVGKGGRFDWNALVREAGLSVVSVHEDLGTIEREPDMVVREAEEFKTNYIVITGMYRFDYSDKQAVSELSDRLNAAGKRLMESGISLLYHNHNCEFRKVEAGKTDTGKADAGRMETGKADAGGIDTIQTAFDILLERTDPEYVNFEFDSYWPTEAGVSALGCMEKLGSRMKLWHINDRGTRVEGPSMTPILTSDSMELGCGNMDLVSLAGQAKRAGVDAVILESHKNWVDKSPIRSLEISGKWLDLNF